MYYGARGLILGNLGPTKLSSNNERSILAEITIPYGKYLDDEILLSARVSSLEADIPIVDSSRLT